MSSVNQALITEAKTLDDALKQLLTIKEVLSSFKEGDIYIQEEWSKWGNMVGQVLQEPKTWISTNHMGFPVKFKVVYVSPQGIPYLQQLTPNGKPTGQYRLPTQAGILKLLMTHINTSAGVADSLETSRFIPDPEQMDAILLDEEFKPMAAHKEKLSVFNDCNKHNKRVTIDTKWNANKVRPYFKSLKPGDKFWTSTDNVYVFQSLNKLSREWDITAVDKNQETVHFNFSYFNHRRLYSECPRSFRRETKT